MTTPLPVLFIHGLWLRSTSWQPWIDLFRDEGYDPSAPGWVPAAIRTLATS